MKTKTRIGSRTSGKTSDVPPEQPLVRHYTSKDYDDAALALKNAIKEDDGVLASTTLKKAQAISEKLYRRLLENTMESGRSGENVLHEATREGAGQVVESLVTGGADVHCFNKDQEMAIHIAADKNFPDIIRTLVTTGGSGADSRGPFERTPLLIAATQGHKDSVEALIQLGCNVNLKASDKEHNVTALHLAAYFGHFDVCQMLIESNADLEAADRHGDRPLHSAARNGMKDCVRLLIQSGANKDSVGFNGRTAFHHAINCGHIDVIRELIHLGIDINAKNNQDKLERTPLHLAVGKKRMDVVKILIDAKVAWLRPDANGDTAFHLAASKGYTGIVDLFLESGLGVETKNIINGWTPLHSAAAAGQTTCMMMLMKRGAEIDFQSSETLETPLGVAIKKGHVEAARMLMQSGASMLIADENGDRPLQLAAVNNQASAIRMLIDSFGANVDARGMDQRTPLHEAARYDKTHAVKALLERMANLELKEVCWPP